MSRRPIQLERTRCSAHHRVAARVFAAAATGLLLLLAPGAVASAPASEGLPLLTRIRDIRALSPDDAERGYPVRIGGTITYLDERNPSGLIIHDGEAGQFVLYTYEFLRKRPPVHLRRGDIVEVEGRTTRGGFAPDVRPETLRKVGHGPLPAPRRLAHAALLSGRNDCQYVEISGVGQRAWLSAGQSDTLFLEVAVDGGTVRASFWGGTKADLRRFTDARIRVRGNVGALFSEAGQLRGVSLLSGRPDEIVMDEPPPDPFGLPLRALSSPFRYSPGGEGDRRIRVRGVVTYQRVGTPVEVSDFTAQLRIREVTHTLYIRDGAAAARVETDQDTPLRAGDVVEVAGFPAVTPTRPALRGAVYRKVGEEPDPRPTPLAASDPVAAERDAELVSVQARVLGLVAGPSERALVLQAGEAPFEAVLEGRRSADGFEDLRTGSLVCVTGIYSYRWGPPPSFRLLLRSPGDVALVEAAPWWTLRHTVVVSIIVALVGSAAVLWVRMIASRHTMERERYQAILAERSRLARELHDTVEQGLAGIKLQLEAVDGSLATSPDAARHSLHVALEMLRYGMEEARRSVLDLRSQALESRDVAGALSDLAERMTSGTSLRAEVRVEGAPRSLAATAEHHLFRIGVEALTNAIKHSGATRVDVALRFADDATELVVSDDGRGFARPYGAAAEHFGLRGIRERVDKLGGVLILEDRPEGGVVLSVRVPLRGPSEPASAAV